MKLLLFVPLFAWLGAGWYVRPHSGPQAGAQKKPEVGKPAPAMRLNDHRGQIVELGGKRANWSVLAFFPKAATPG
jgi:hypothetical protein